MLGGALYTAPISILIGHFDTKSFFSASFVKYELRVRAVTEVAAQNTHADE
jgi:hypothetical protein